MMIRELVARVARLERAVAILACMLVELNGGKAPLREAIQLMRSGRHFGISIELDGEELNIGLTVDSDAVGKA